MIDPVYDLVSASSCSLRWINLNRNFKQTSGRFIQQTKRAVIHFIHETYVPAIIRHQNITKVCLDRSFTSLLVVKDAQGVVHVLSSGLSILVPSDGARVPSNNISDGLGNTNCCGDIKEGCCSVGSRGDKRITSRRDHRHTSDRRWMGIFQEESDKRGFTRKQRK